MINFKEFPKMARLSREIIITEKIDGTNASIFIQHESLESEESIDDKEIIAKENGLTLRAGSRTRWIRVGDDNHGFAGWVTKNASELFKLGEGLHFGEWWGQGIQRGYGMKEKVFSLFNVSRWDSEDRPSCCRVVPTLYKGIFDTEKVEKALTFLKEYGSLAEPSFKNPEGVIVFHTAANIGFKKTILKDESPKSLIK